MKFLNPNGLWLLVFVPVLIIIYLIKSQHEDKAVSSTYLWKLSNKFKKNKLPAQKLKRLLSFIMQLIIVISVSLIASKPSVITGQVCDYIAILDVSASMQTVDEDGNSRFDEAVDEIYRLAEKTRGGNTLSIILSGEKSQCLVEKATSMTEIQAALDGVSAGNGKSVSAEAIKTAQRLCDSSKNAKVMFYTDCEYAQTENVEVVNFNREEWNVSLQGLKAEKNETQTVFKAELVSYNGPAELTLGLKIDGKATDIQTLSIVSNAPCEVEFIVKGLAHYDTAEVYFEAEDGLALDNSYVLCQKPQKKYNVLLVSPSPLYLESALNSLGNCNVKVAGMVGGEKLTGYDLYIFDSVEVPVYPDDASVIVFGNQSTPLGVSLGAPSRDPQELKINAEFSSPITEGVTFEDTVISEYSLLTGDNGWKGVLNCDGKNVMLTKSLNKGFSMSVISFDLHNTNLPLQTDYLKFMKNLVEYSIPSLVEKTDYEAGETVEITVLSKAEEIHAEYPDKSIKELSTIGDTAKLHAEQIGVYTAVMKTKDGGEYADFFVHIPIEDMRPSEGTSLQIDHTPEEVNDTTATEEIFMWFAILMLALILIEWGWYCYEQF